MPGKISLPFNVSLTDNVNTFDILFHLHSFVVSDKPELKALECYIRKCFASNQNTLKGRLIKVKTIVKLKNKVYIRSKS